jgi:hypothetical protein
LVSVAVPIEVTSSVETGYDELELEELRAAETVVWLGMASVVEDPEIMVVYGEVVVAAVYAVELAAAEPS